MNKKNIFLLLGILLNADYTLSSSSSSGPTIDSPELKQCRTFQSFSTIVEEKQLNHRVKEFIENSNTNIRIAVDQFTDLTMAGLLVKRAFIVNTEVITGDNDKKRKKSSEQEETPHQKLLNTFTSCIELSQIVTTNSGNKMHNKFIVRDASSIATGSPNLSLAANNNSECLIQIDNDQELANIYMQYFAYIKNSNSIRSDELETYLKSYNETYKGQINICLAPILNIRDFIKEYIYDAQTILINMFLLSRSKKTNSNEDIIKALEQASIAGASITIRVDGLSYDSTGYMQRALRFLKGKINIKIDKVYLRGKKQYFHDKLLLITKNDGTKIVILGSAGFTDKVQDNKNFENMIAITNQSVFNYFENHFNSIKPNTEKINSVLALDAAAPTPNPKPKSSRNKSPSSKRTQSERILKPFTLKAKEASPSESKGKEKISKPRREEGQRK